jgi:nitrous oxidase accessory protein NosD
MNIDKSRVAGLCAAALVALAPLGLAGNAFAGTDNGKPITVSAGQSIQRAIDRARPGETIAVAPGVYHENLLVTKDHLTLRGARGTVLEPPAKASANACNEFGRVTGICVLGQVDTKTNALGRPVVGTRISGFAVRGFSRFGIELANTRNSTIAENEIARNRGWGVIGLFLSRVRYVRNDVHDNRQGGLYIGDSADARALVTANRSYRNGGQGGIGIYLKNAPHGIVSRNRVTDNCVGILFVGVGRGAMSHWVARDNIVRRNTHACRPSDEGGPPLSGFGIALLGTDHVVLDRNRIEANRPSERTPLAGGLIVAAAPVPGGVAASVNTIRGNRISGNAPADVIYDGRGHGNTFAGNDCTTARPATLCGPLVTSRYLTMRDGVRIAVDVWLPRHHDTKIPALVRATVLPRTSTSLAASSR